MERCLKMRQSAVGFTRRRQSCLLRRRGCQAVDKCGLNSCQEVYTCYRRESRMEIPVSRILR